MIRKSKVTPNEIKWLKVGVMNAHLIGVIIVIQLRIDVTKFEHMVFLGMIFLSAFYCSFSILFLSS